MVDADPPLLLPSILSWNKLGVMTDRVILGGLSNDSDPEGGHSFAMESSVAERKLSLSELDELSLVLLALTSDGGVDDEDDASS